MEKDLILNGFRVGEYGFESEDFYKIVEDKYSEGMNYILISPPDDEIPQETYIDWAKYLTDKKIYFSFWGGGTGNHFGFSKDTAKRMKDIAGKYFFSYEMSELGSAYACKPSGYKHNPQLVYKDLQHAKDTFVSKATEHSVDNGMGGVLDTSVIESTSMINYIAEAGSSFPRMEIWPGNVEISTTYARGTASAYNCDNWGVYMAHEFYGGLKCDALKEKRFKMGYDYCYLAGGNFFINESGDEKAGSHEEDWFDFNHPICQNYRRVMSDFAKFAKEDFRPKGGPKVRVAFVRGNLDGSSFRHSGGVLWRAHQQKEYGYGPAEFAWRILDTIQCKRRWCDVHNYGEVDLSATPGYGLYDVIPATVGADVFAKYDYLIFVGWNSMTQEIYDNLTAYVKQGGRLFMTAAHLNTSIQRDGSISLLNGGDVTELFGCTLDAENPVCREDGSKFCNSIVPEFIYPTVHFDCGDPYFAEGFINYANTKLTTGVATARLSNTFVDKDVDIMPISLVENKCGDGYAVLMTNLEYPYGAAVPMYQNLVREILVASHRTADIKVYGADSVRFSVYEGGKIYLLNTDFDNKVTVNIDYGTHKKEIMLEPCEFKPVEKE